MIVEYEIELENALKTMFPNREERQRVVAKMGKYGEESYQREAPRVKLSILKLAYDDPGRLDHYIDEACKDYRDILCWAEYPHTSRNWRLRELDPERYNQLRNREEAEFLAWLEHMHR